MNRIITQKIPRILVISLLISVVSLGTFSCMPTSEADFLQSLLEQTESIGGEMTLVTKDGETVTITISKNTKPAVSEEPDENEQECEEETNEKRNPDSPSLSDILPSFDSIESVFINLGVWEKASALREQGLSWSTVAAELGYNEESMYTQLQEIIEQRLHHARELGLINQEQFEYKFKHYSELASKWIGKIFADKPVSDKEIPEDFLPSLNSKEDVFRTLGLWADADMLLDEGLSWSHVARELGYIEEKMYKELLQICEERLHSAKMQGLITYEQYKEKLEYYNELSLKWVDKIFAN